MDNGDKNLTDKIWEAFSSMKLGLALLGVIALVSAIGTFFPQISTEPEKAQTVGTLWRTLGFTDLYSTWWFRLLLGLLGINLFICSVQRFPGLYAKTFGVKAVRTVGEVPGLMQIELNGESGWLARNLAEILAHKRYYLIKDEWEKGWGFTAIKHRWGYWGSLITHLSFVVLLVGALAGALFGFKGYFWAGSGSTVPLQQIELSRGRVSQTFSVRVNSAEDRILPTGERDNWYTDLSIVEGGKEVARQTLSVNHPFAYQGVTFYQASFAHGVNLTAEMKGQKVPVVLQERGGNYFQAPGTDLYLIVAAMKKDMQNPVILYQVYQGNNPEPVQSGQLQKGETAKVKDAYQITLDGYAGFTGLQVKEDPGVSLIWVGSVLLLFGLMLSFYWRPVVICGVFSEGENGGKLVLGATGKSKSLVHEEFSLITEKLKTSTDAD
ncbi:cytochrome c biogenesis protein ResB [Paradesulfitobacterium aromaticivorans]